MSHKPWKTKEEMFPYYIYFLEEEKYPNHFVLALINGVTRSTNE